MVFPEKSSINVQNQSESEAQIAGKHIQEALRLAITNIRQEKSNNRNTTDFKILASAQATVASQRHQSLMQEVGCAAANDVMTINFSTRLDEINLPNLSANMNAILLQEEEVNGINININININIRILEVSYLNTLNFHSENSCTQYIYHYLLPLKWLQDGDKLEQWWLLYESEKDEKVANENEIENQIESKEETSRLRHPGSFQTNPPSTSLKAFRSALKNAESITLPNRRVRRRLLHENNAITNRKINKVGTRRMGTITNKERRAFHNFADPRLQGEASPNQEPVWRVLDKCRIAEIKKNPMSDEVVAVLEFRGDAFLPQQIRRIVGTAVGITNGWLPKNTFDIATRPDISLETALAPSRRLYLKDLRFHFDESNEDFCKYDNLVASESVDWLQHQMFVYSSNTETAKNEMKWLCDMEENITPKVCSQIRQVDACYRSESEHALLDAEVVTPTTYSRALDLLREISVSGWPETSIARAKVIKNASMIQRLKEKEGGHGKSNFGSFTLVNPRLFLPDSAERFPLGNELFPDLVEAVFELEGNLKEGRKSSTHCAINFNASFTPHVDSGTGLGQSLSMIVGLGDYKGGEIFVEGDAYPIRYQPLEFDGWKQRHWTGAYSGERFSLVWFTPAERR